MKDALRDNDPAVARRIRSAWLDIEVTTRDLQRRFNLSAEALKNLGKDLGPRPSFGISLQRGAGVKSDNISNGHAR